MDIVGGLDVHRKQITFDYVETETGEVVRGEVRPATREHLRSWLSRFCGKRAAFALEATTGWRFVVEELLRAGCELHLGRAGGHHVSQRPQEAGHDRSPRCPALEGAALDRAAARVVDPTFLHPGA